MSHKKETDYLKSVGKRVKQARLIKGVTVKELAKMMGYSTSKIYNIERGNYSPSVKNIKDIAAFLDVSPSFLLCLDDSVVDERTVCKSFIDLINKKLDGLNSDDLKKVLKFISDLEISNVQW